jgi:hypothetical protein
MKYDIEEIKNLSCWMIERIALNRNTVIDEELGCDWNWVAGEVWDFYPGIVNEFAINEAIDFIVEAAECSE